MIILIVLIILKIARLTFSKGIIRDFVLAIHTFFIGCPPNPYASPWVYLSSRGKSMLVIDIVGVIFFLGLGAA